MISRWWDQIEFFFSMMIILNGFLIWCHHIYYYWYIYLDLNIGVIEFWNKDASSTENMPSWIYNYLVIFDAKTVSFF